MLWRSITELGRRKMRQHGEAVGGNQSMIRNRWVIQRRYFRRLIPTLQVEADQNGNSMGRMRPDNLRSYEVTGISMIVLKICLLLPKYLFRTSKSWGLLNMSTEAVFPTSPLKPVPRCERNTRPSSRSIFLSRLTSIARREGPTREKSWWRV